MARTQTNLARFGLAALLLHAGFVRPLRAQVDYRNLDDDRPTRVEDAYPVERWAFEVLAPWRFERERGGRAKHLFVPELAHGILPNTQVGLKLPIAGVSSLSGREWALAGARLFALYNFNTESFALPALSLRTDLALPLGALGGGSARVGLKGIATRSWGRQRMHLNASFAAGGDDPGEGEPLPRWSAGVAVDHTAFRQSLLLVGEVYSARVHDAGATEVAVSTGARMQVRPTLVMDLGLVRRLSGAGPDIGVTLGFSHAFALTALMPSVGPRTPPGGAR